MEELNNENSKDLMRLIQGKFIRLSKGQKAHCRVHTKKIMIKQPL